MKPVVHVAVGVILNTQQKILISHRAKHLHQGGLWEFPGGKVEAAESVQVALSRELSEELGISVKACSPLMKVEHDYGDKQVLLDVWIVDQVEGQACGCEGQAIKWVMAAELDNYTFPVANQAIVKKVQNYIANLR